MRPRSLVPALAACLLLPSPASAYDRPGRTQLISLAANGKPTNAFNVYPSISSDGRYVAFVSASSGLVPGDLNGVDDAFVHDRATGETRLASLGHDGAQQAGGTKHAHVSQSGRWVTFDSPADGLVPGDANGKNDIFVRDLHEGTTELVSVARDGTAADGDSGFHDISGDGRLVVFESSATNLVAGDTNARSDIFVRDLERGTTTRVSVALSGAQGTNTSHSPSISENGRFVVFASYAANLVANDNNGYQDTFMHDLATRATERVSLGHAGAEPNHYSSFGVTDDSGRYVVFGSWATNLVPADTGGYYDLFIRDRMRGTTDRLSVSSEGAQANGASDEPSITSDGRFVSFVSGASNLIEGDTNGKTDAFVRDLVTGAVERVSLADGGAQINGHVLWRPQISAEGGEVVFVSDAPSLGGGEEVHVRVRGPVTGVGDLEVRAEGTAVEAVGFATFTGRMLSEATDPAGDGGTALGDVGGDLTRVSIAHQAELEQLLIRWDVASMPKSPTGAGSPAVVYGLTFYIGAIRYEVRATNVGATAILPSAPAFGLYRCEAVCTQTFSLSGSIGTAGRTVMVGLPVATLGLAAGGTLGSIRAFTGFGESSGNLSRIEEVPLTAATVPSGVVQLGVAPVQAKEEDVAFTIKSEVVAGWFGAAIDTGNLGPGAYRVWARACLPPACSARSAIFTV